MGKVPGVDFTNSPLKEDGKKQLKVFGVLGNAATNDFEKTPGR
jgi:hypothetical protein